ncbi:myeloid leukemia factor [Artemisia annua]|uniref:Myeloid leukemia factor n=1 Tax=Artemisia annua TaxID=35608 RepID=A0A2U1KNN6_ARTAN|nr:myeloid leukemia factor [Artemisia annua]
MIIFSGDPHAHMKIWMKSEKGSPSSRDSKLTQFGNEFSMMNTRSGPQAQSYTFQSSTVTYGGSNGAYYTSSTTKRTGSDGLRFEEYKEVDSVTGQAAHRLSREIPDKVC